MQPRHCAGRLKQWLHALQAHYPEAARAFADLRRVSEPAQISAYLALLDAPPAAALAGAN